MLAVCGCGCTDSARIGRGSRTAAASTPCHAVAGFTHAACSQGTWSRAVHAGRRGHRDRWGH